MYCNEKIDQLEKFDILAILSHLIPQHDISLNLFKSLTSYSYICNLYFTFLHVFHLIYPQVFLNFWSVVVFLIFFFSNSDYFIYLFNFLKLRIVCFFIFYFFTLQYCIGFAIHQHESDTGVHVFLISISKFHCVHRNRLLKIILNLCVETLLNSLTE